MKRLLSHILAGIAGIYVSALLIPGVELLAEKWKVALLAGITLGVFNAFIKPVLKFLTFPLIIITIGLFSFVINVIIVWSVDILFPALVIEGLLPLLAVSALLSVINSVVYKLAKS